MDECLHDWIIDDVFSYNDEGFPVRTHECRKCRKEIKVIDPELIVSKVDYNRFMDILRERAEQGIGQSVSEERCLIDKLKEKIKEEIQSSKKFRTIYSDDQSETYYYSGEIDAYNTILMIMEKLSK